MSVRTKMILIFLGLSVVPLALLTWLSYSSSRQSLRSLVERDNRAAAANLQGRVSSLSGEIRERLVAVTEMPEFEDIDFSKRLTPSDTEKLASGMRREVGDQWDVFTDLRFEAETGTAAAAGGHRLAEPAAPSPPTGRVPMLPALAAPATTSSDSHGELPEDAGGGRVAEADEETEADAGEDSFRMRILLPDFAQLMSDSEAVPELRQYEIDFEKGAPTADSLDRLAAEMESLVHNIRGLFVETGGDGHMIKLRNLEGDARTEFIHLGEVTGAAAAVDELQLTRRRRLAILERFDRDAEDLAQPIVVPVEREGRQVGSVVARVRPDRMLADVFGGTVLEPGEIVFAVDPLGRLHARQLADLETLRDLGLVADGPASRGRSGPAPLAVTRDPEALLKAIQQPGWITIIEQDEDTGYTFGIVRRVDAELGSIRKAAMMNLFFGFLFIGLAGSGVILFSRRLTWGLELLADGARQIAAGDLTHRLDASRKDELGQLAVAFNEMASDLDASRERLVEQERLERELEIAHNIQRDSLPQGHFTGENVEIVGRSIPSLEVGGDFFNFLPLGAGRTAIIVGDVSGKGVPAALMMAEIQAMFRTLLLYQDDPAHIVAQINRDLVASKPANVYFTVFFGILDPRRGRLTFVNAGHTPPFIMRLDGEVVSLGPNSRPVGLFEDSPMSADTVVLLPGDLLCMYTDGVVESSSREKAEEFFGEARLVDVIRAAVNRPLDRVIDEVAVQLTGFHGDGALEDDATLVVARLGMDTPGQRPMLPDERAGTSSPSDSDLPVV